MAQAISNTGDGVRRVALPWLASLLTRDPALIALVGVATQSAWLLFSLPVGSLMDRVDRRRAIVLALIVQFAVAGVVAGVVWSAGDALGSPTAPITIASPGIWLGLLTLAALVLSAVEVIRDIGAQTLIPDLAPAEDLERANSWTFTAEIVTNELVGPPLGGLLLAAALWIPFGLDAVTFAASAVLIASIAGSFKQATDSEAHRKGRIRESMTWLWHHRVLRAMTLSLAANNLLNAMAFATVVLFAQEILNLGAVGFSVIQTGGAIAGLAGGVAAERLIRRLGRGRLLLIIVAVSALSMAVIGFTSSAVVVWAAMAPPFFFGVVWSVLSRSLRQRLTPTGQLGRVTGAHRTLNFGALPVGFALGGLIVTGAEQVVTRAWALRTPFLLAAAGLLTLLPYIAKELNEQRITEAIEHVT